MSAEDTWRRRRRLAEVFGEESEVTRDDREDASDAARGRRTPDESAGDRWLRDQVPPHHG